MGQPGAVMISLGRQKNLRLVLQPAKGFGMQNTVPVPLIYGSDVTLRLRPFPPPGFSAVSGKFAQLPVLIFLKYFPNGHEIPPDDEISSILNILHTRRISFFYMKFREKSRPAKTVKRVRRSPAQLPR